MTSVDTFTLQAFCISVLFILHPNSPNYCKWNKCFCCYHCVCVFFFCLFYSWFIQILYKAKFFSSFIIWKIEGCLVIAHKVNVLCSHCTENWSVWSRAILYLGNVVFTNRGIWYDMYSTVKKVLNKHVRFV